ncbi:ABC transporter ATP-binding protein [Pradoshia sp. D12]|uniref:ABC transporter ATP-binding protein n=1 Tax=Bacillaceae TaxID=186817 RepID=UPI001122B24A|nr:MULTISPECIES: ATP-binding cassette domain-containing protein [Bacillaceae]QFK71153.1 ABC transporter ATP-binding protein [Pradoshia sp. D12]TPF72946.1 ABC transporter ATP-binding protein [Bacillus sp. D12]
MEKIIEVRRLTKTYGDITAVNDIDFYVEQGKLFAFLGPNGAGKSTTIDMLCTLLKPDKGEIIINGFQIAKNDSKIRESIGVVFQESLLDPLLTVRENLLTRAKFYQIPKSELKSRVEQAAIAADVMDFIDRPYGKLSGGQRRRADIARALVNTPKVLFLDEPTTGLDPQTRRSVWETITNLQRDQGLTVFLTTHYMEEAASADYIMIIDDGEIVAKGTPYELRNTYSSDMLKIEPIDYAALDELFQANGISYKNEHQLMIIKIANTKEALSILKLAEPLIANFEVMHGTMDDVFIEITGKEIRADV